jgi:transposase
MKMIVDELYPNAKKITIVMDNLNTHTPASLYSKFEPEEARRITEKLDIQYTPKHGSWLNMAEIEFSALSRQCLNRRIGTTEELMEEIKAWEIERNKAVVKCNWRFRTEDARIKLKKLYPAI